MRPDHDHTPQANAPEPPHLWYRRYQSLRRKLALVVAAAALCVGGILWLAKTMFSIQPGKGTPTGWTVRTDRHVATWIQTLEPYIPSLHRDHSKDRYALAVCVVPLDGGAARLVPVHRNLTPNQFALARILGSDGSSLWVEAHEVSAIDLQTWRVRTPAGPIPRDLAGTPTARLRPDPLACLAAGYLLDDDRWLGLLAPDEVARSYGPRQFVRRVVPAVAAKVQRQFHRASVERDDSGKYFRVAAIDAIAPQQYFDAAFLRRNGEAEPFRLQQPSGALMVHTSAPGLGGTLVVARTTDDGALVWQRDTGLDRFALQQILPGETVTAFVGTRPREPDRVPEPLLVLVEHATGAAYSHSMWW